MEFLEMVYFILKKFNELEVQIEKKLFPGEHEFI